MAVTPRIQQVQVVTGRIRPAADAGLRSRRGAAAMA